VFVVGYLGDWRRAAAVLFERESLLGHPAPRRETGQGVAGTIAASTGGCDENDARDGRLIAFGGNNTTGSIDVATAVNAKSTTRQDFETETLLVAHSLRAEGLDASEDGTGRGTPLVPVPFDTTQITSKTNRSNPRAGDPCHPLAAGAHAPAIAFNARQDPDSWSECVGPIDTHGATHAVAFQSSQSGVRLVDSHATLDANNGSRRHNGVMQGSAVRRLMPIECERLQGFSDRYTAINFNGKPAKDGPRYKALGNSMAVNAMRWIGDRIQFVESLTQPMEAA
jgi:DNA (cytosine-5)-methyltransferase 1